jgi:hypothetical protein
LLCRPQAPKVFISDNVRQCVAIVSRALPEVEHFLQDVFHRIELLNSLIPRHLGPIRGQWLSWWLLAVTCRSLPLPATTCLPPELPPWLGADLVMVSLCCPAGEAVTSLSFAFWEFDPEAKERARQEYLAKPGNTERGLQALPAKWWRARCKSRIPPPQASRLASRAVLLRTVLSFVLGVV